MMSCGSSRKVVSSEKELRVEGLELRDSVVVQSLVVLDTLKEITTITVDRNDKGDTLRLVQVTERDRYRNRDRVREEQQKTVVKTDTIYVAVRDSVSSSTFQDSGPANKKSNFVAAMKWICFIILGLIGLIITVKVSLRRFF